MQSTESTRGRPHPASSEIAQAWASQGFYVLPVDGKVPLLGPGWPQKTSNDPTVVEKWFQQWPDANIGLDLLKSGVLAVDQDSPAAETLAHKLGLKGGLKRLSRAPAHLFRRPDSAPATRKRHPECPQLELLGNGHLVVYGRHANGARIEVESPSGTTAPSRDDLEEAPGWITLVLTSEKRGRGRPAIPLKDAEQQALLDELERRGCGLQGPSPSGWYNGRCPLPGHVNEDEHPSFGVNLETGIANCFAGHSSLPLRTLAWRIGVVRASSRQTAGASDPLAGIEMPPIWKGGDPESGGVARDFLLEEGSDPFQKKISSDLPTRTAAARGWAEAVIPLPAGVSPAYVPTALTERADPSRHALMWRVSNSWSNEANVAIRLRRMLAHFASVFEMAAESGGLWRVDIPLERQEVGRDRGIEARKRLISGVRRAGGRYRWFCVPDQDVAVFIADVALPDGNPLGDIRSELSTFFPQIRPGKPLGYSRWGRAHDGSQEWAPPNVRTGEWRVDAVLPNAVATEDAASFKEEAQRAGFLAFDASDAEVQARAPEEIEATLHVLDNPAWERGFAEYRWLYLLADRLSMRLTDDAFARYTQLRPIFRHRRAA